LDFTGKVALVTGGATGIGRATSLAYARQGATVVIGDVDDRAAETVGLIEAAGGTGLFVRTDVTIADDVDRLVQTAVDTYGGLHVAFNNAGILPPTGPLLDQTEATTPRCARWSWPAHSSADPPSLRRWPAWSSS
jgi:NAD(P)-dependent dehydrogenase (short-subunit alcohol dehydrogenase family)